MNTDKNRVNLQFAPEIKFAVRTAPFAPFRAALENDFEQLKNRLLAAQLDIVERPELNAVVRRAANEAAALAWVTFHPLLVFPRCSRRRPRRRCATPNGRRAFSPAAANCSPHEPR